METVERHISAVCIIEIKSLLELLIMLKRTTDMQSMRQSSFSDNLSLTLLLLLLVLCRLISPAPPVII